MLVHVASVVFEPITTGYSFRWGGEFSPQSRGPQAYARSSPLPLPSAIAGALAGLVFAETSEPLCKEQGIYDDTMRGLRRLFCNKGTGRVALRGPYLYMEQGRNWILCAPIARSQYLFCVAETDYELKVCKVSTRDAQFVGIALNDLTKNVLEGYIYTSIYTDPVSILNNAATSCGLSNSSNSSTLSGILVEAYAEKDCATNQEKIRNMLSDKIVQLGGEARPARTRITNGAPGLKLAKTLEKQEEVPLYIASPLLLKDKKDKPALTQQADKIIKSIITSLGLTPTKRQAKGEKLRLTAIGLGYNLCRNKRRPYHAAILPGATLLVTRPKNLREAYIKGFGAYSELGWGTLLPIPYVLELKGKHCRS